MAGERLTLALAQMAVDEDAREVNFRRAAEMVASAARAGAALVLLPELWGCGYSAAHFPACADALDEGLFARMAALAAAYRIAVGGSHVERHGERLYNTFALYGPDGRRWGIYRKVHRFLPLGEGVLTAGDAVGLVETPWGAAGLAVCYDLRFPEMFRVQRSAGVPWLLLVAAWPLSRVAHWNALLRARAVENQAFVVAVNRAGRQGETRFGGHSVVLTPRGEVVAQAGKDEALVLAGVDLSQAGAYREAFPVWAHRRPEAYRLPEGQA